MAGDIQRFGSSRYAGMDAHNPDDMGARGRLAWWKEKRKHVDEGSDDTSIGGALVETVRRILMDQTDHMAMQERHLRMYRNLAAQGTMPISVMRLSDALGYSLMPRIGLNVARPMCNTVVSKITKSRPRIMFATDGGGRAAKDLARYRELFVDGLFYQERLHVKERRSFLDETVFGTGFVKVFDQGKRVHFERVFSPEVIVDRVEGADGAPRNMYQIKFVDRDVLAAKFPKLESKIANIKPSYTTDTNIWWRNYTDQNPHNMLMVTMGWHLPSSESKGDGAWAIGIEGLTLDSGQWTDDEHCFIAERWSQSPDGFYGMGLCEELVGIQAEINRIMRRIQQGMILLSNPFIFIHAQSGLVPAHIQGIPGTVLKHNGFEPKFHAPTTVNPEVFGHLDRLFLRAFELSGISQQSAMAKIPANLESGRAQLVAEDVQSDRLAAVEMTRRELYLQCALRGIKCAARSGYEVTLMDPAGRLVRKVKAKDLGLNKDDFVCKAWDTSILPATPEGRLDIIERMAAQGLIVETEDKLALLDDMDVTRSNHRRLSPRRYLERLFESMLYEGARFIPPDSALPIRNPDGSPGRAITLAQDIYLEGLADGAPEEGLTKVSNWIAQALALPGGKPPAAPSPPIGAPGMPPGLPPPGLPGAPGGLPVNAGPEATIMPPVPVQQVA